MWEAARKGGDASETNICDLSTDLPVIQVERDVLKYRASDRTDSLACPQSECNSQDVEFADVQFRLVTEIVRVKELEHELQSRRTISRKYSRIWRCEIRSSASHSRRIGERNS
jgi:hypothetical protein